MNMQNTVVYSNCEGLLGRETAMQLRLLKIGTNISNITDMRVLIQHGQTSSIGILLSIKGVRPMEAAASCDKSTRARECFSGFLGFLSYSSRFIPQSEMLSEPSR